MALPNPNQTNQAPAVQEELIAEWQEPQLPSLLSGIRRPHYAIAGAIVVSIVLIILAIIFHNLNVALPILVLLSAGGAVYSQNRRTSASRTITLTTTRLQIGRRSYAFTDLAGFWLESTEQFIVINIEPKKPTAMPITALYVSHNNEECHDLLLEVLAEVEPRAETITDRINKLMHF
jgi:hypothetical protein